MYTRILASIDKRSKSEVGTSSASQSMNDEEDLPETDNSLPNPSPLLQQSLNSTPVGASSSREREFPQQPDSSPSFRISNIVGQDNSAHNNSQQQRSRNDRVDPIVEMNRDHIIRLPDPMTAMNSDPDWYTPDYSLPAYPNYSSQSAAASNYPFSQNGNNNSSAFPQQHNSSPPYRILNIDRHLNSSVNNNAEQQTSSSSSRNDMIDPIVEMNRDRFPDPMTAMNSNGEGSTDEEENIIRFQFFIVFTNEEVANENIILHLLITSSNGEQELTDEEIEMLATLCSIVIWYLLIDIYNDANNVIRVPHNDSSDYDSDGSSNSSDNSFLDIWDSSSTSARTAAEDNDESGFSTGNENSRNNTDTEVEDQSSSPSTSSYQ